MKGRRSPQIKVLSTLERPALMLLGPTRLSASGGVIEGIERKMAAMLAYLALEGPTPRQKIAGLLWPEVPETSARNTLRQLLHRLRRMVGDGVVVLDDPLWLTRDVQVDVLELLEHAKQGRAKAMLEFGGELLSGLDYDDCLEMAEWVEAERERLRDLRQRALEVEVVRLEREGEYDAALQYTEALIDADPASEEAYRSLMRLHHLRGDRTAALRAFERCKAALELHLGIEPLPDTLVLAQQIEQGSTTPTATQRRIPLSILRPPVLAGREREWARLEAARKAGLGIFVSGVPGVGKTRLVMDFAAAATEGQVLRMEGRPGDAEIPFSTVTRHFRQYLHLIKIERLEPFVRQELSRLVPELWPDPPLPITSDTEKLRLFDAAAELMNALSFRFFFVMDDLQYYDPASFELVMHVIQRFAGREEAMVPGVIGAFRKGELQPRTEQRIHQSVDAGLAVLIELQALSSNAVEVMLAGLDQPGLEGLTESLSGFTGGNPLFIVETLKGLFESGEIEQSKLPERFAVPAKVGAIISKRLERLSPEALKLARVAAVARADFDLELAGKVLQADALDLAVPYEELESAQIWRGNWFTHDLIYETLRNSTPDAMQKVLHSRTAKALEELDGDSARIAEHWMAAGQEVQAAPWWLKAAEVAQAHFRLDEALGFIEQSVAIWEQQGDRQAVFEALQQLVNIARQQGDTEGLVRVIERLSGLSDTASQKARVWLAQALRHNLLGDGAAALRAAQQGLEQAHQAGDERTELELLNQEAVALWHLERLEESAERLRKVLDRGEKQGRLDVMMEAASNLAVTMDHLELRHQATPYHRKAVEYSARTGHRVKQAEALLNLAVNQSEMGLSGEGLTTLNQAQSLSGGVQGELEAETFILGQLGITWSGLGDYRQALHYLGLALESARKHATWVEGSLLLNLARTSLILGAFSEAQDQLDKALASPNPPPRRRATVLVIRANLLLAQGQAAEALLSEAQSLMVPGRRLITWINLWLTQAIAGPAEQGLEYARKALEVAQASHLHGLHIAALIRQARLLLELGQTVQALECSEQAQEFCKSYTCDFYEGELRWIHCRALEANHHEGAPQYLKATFDWLMDVADTKVPPEYRKSFLENNPVNRAILERYDPPIHTLAPNSGQGTGT